MATIRGISHSLFAEHEIPKRKNIVTLGCTHLDICEQCKRETYEKI